MTSASRNASPPACSSQFVLRPDNRCDQLLTSVSHFPSRMLPPPGTTPRNFISAPCRNGVLVSGTRVKVRRYNIRKTQWMPWVIGTVVSHRVERFYVGTELDLYEVETGKRPNTSVETYIPFLGELRDGVLFEPSDSVNEMLFKIADMKKVFACVQIPSGSNGSFVSAWAPAILVSRRSDPVNRVSILAGPLRGQTEVPAPHILPYNPETAEAIRKTGQLMYSEPGTV